MKYTKSLTGGILAAVVTAAAYFVWSTLNSYEHHEDPSHMIGVDSFTMSVGLPGPRGLLLLGLAFLAGFFATLITSRQNDA